MSTGIRVYVSELANSGNNAVTGAHDATIYDGRLSAPPSSAATIAVVASNDRALFLHPVFNLGFNDRERMGVLYNYRIIDGEDHDSEFEGTVVTDAMTYAERSKPLSIATRTLLSCTATAGSNYDATILSSANMGR